MEIMTAQEKKEMRRRRMSEKCNKVAERYEELLKQGYSAFYAKSIIADEMLLTVQTIYNYIRIANISNSQPKDNK